jgi:hypothetical protein
MTNDSNSVAGRALYLEFSHSSTAYQMLLVPGGAAASGNLAGFTVYRRQMNPGATRKSWRVARASSVTPLSLHDVHAKETVTSYARDVITVATDSVMQQFVNRGWQLCKEPIVVEMTKTDYDSVLMGRIPYKVMGRVAKVRKRLGFVDIWKS